MTKTIDFYYDLGSPNCYMANRVLRPIAERAGAQINYIPMLLGGVFKATGNQPPWMAYANVQPKMAYEMLELQRFIKNHGLSKFKFNPHFPVNTLMLMRGAVAAKTKGEIDQYLAAGEACVWEEGLKMDDPEVYVKGLTDHGLDGAAYLASTQEQDVKDALIAYTGSAVERGVFGAPTYFIGDEMWFGKDRLAQVEAALG